MVDVDVDGPKSAGLAWGLAATRRSVYIHQVNRVNSRNDSGHDDSTINIVVVIIIIFKPQAGKLGYTYKIMVATAIYSVTMVLWKETAFPLCRATERRWKRTVASRVSPVILLLLLLLLLLSLSSCLERVQRRGCICSMWCGCQGAGHLWVGSGGAPALFP